MLAKMGRAWSQGKSQFSFFVAVVVVAVVVVVVVVVWCEVTKTAF